VKKPVLDLKRGDVIEYFGGLFYEISHDSTLDLEKDTVVIHYLDKSDPDHGPRIMNVHYKEDVKIRVFHPDEVEFSIDELKALSGV
jgi:hypothetical protein